MRKRRSCIQYVTLVFLIIFTVKSLHGSTPVRQLCDLVITNVSWTPEQPKQGDTLTFTATIMNIGRAASPNGVIHGVIWQINKGTVHWSDYYTKSIKPGESVTLNTSGGIGYYAIQGTHTLDVYVDPEWDVNRIAETDKSNNHYSTELVIAAAMDKDTGQVVLPLIPSSEIHLTSADIGGFANIPGEMGKTVVVDQGQAYTITSKGHEIALHSACDWHHFAYLVLEGDFDIHVRVDEVVAPFTNYDGSGALVARASLDGSSPLIDIKALVPGSLHGNGNFSGRKVVGGNLFAGEDKLFRGGGAISEKGNPVWLRMHRQKNRFFGYYSHDGVLWNSLNSIYAEMPEKMYVGIAASPFGFDIPVTVRFSNLKVHGFQARKSPPDFNWGSGMGLNADYFDGRNFETPLFSRIDSVADFSFEYGNPVDLRMGYENYSIKWAGFLQALSSGKHTIYVVVDDGVRLWFNEELVIDEWHDQAATGFKFEVELARGIKYPLAIDYFDGKIGGMVRLLWESENMPLTRIPASQLYPAKNDIQPHLAEKQTERITSLTEAEHTILLGDARVISKPFASNEKATEIPPREGAGLRWKNIDGGQGGIHYLNVVYQTPETSWLNSTKDIYVNGQLIDQYHFFPEGVKSYHLKIKLKPGNENSISIQHGPHSKGTLYVDFLGIDNSFPDLPLAPARYH